MIKGWKLLGPRCCPEEKLLPDSSMWPFSPKAELPPEQTDRMRRRCGVAARTLQHCLAANPGDPGICSSLETQVVHCHAEVVCLQLAAEHQRCFKRVVNSQGKEPFSTCDKHVEAMRKCLRRYGLYPFHGSSSTSGGARATRRATP